MKTGDIRAQLRRSPVRRVLVLRRHVGLRRDDVFIASFPKSGNTWVKFMLAEAVHGQEVDFESAERYVPMVGKHRRSLALLPGDGRLIKTHEPYRKVYRRAIYLVRDVRDVAVSSYYYYLWLNRFDGPVEEFIPLFLTGELHGYGTWRAHVRSWLRAAREREGIVFQSYEELRADPVSVLARMLDFIGVRRDREQVEAIVERNTLQRMREKEERARQRQFRAMRSGYAFVRRGAVGGWREVLPERSRGMLEESAREELEELGYLVEGKGRGGGVGAAGGGSFGC